VSASRDEHITSVWNMEDGIKLCSQACPVTYAAYFTADDSQIVAFNKERIICVSDAATGVSKLNFAAMNSDGEVLGGVGTKKNICYTRCEERLGV
jgi:hypothetical protein